jgi:hypothetical protein
MLPQSLRLWVRLLPWELARTRRALAYESRRQLALWREMQERVDQSKPVQAWLNKSQTPSEAVQTTPFARFRTSYWFTGELLQETRRRGLKLVWDLQIWRHQHGDYPENLEQLQREAFVDVPVDPLSGKRFQFHRQGPAELSVAGGTRFDGALWPVAAGQPYVSIVVPGPYTPQYSLGITQEITVKGETVEVPVLPGASFPIPE